MPEFRCTNLIGPHESVFEQVNDTFAIDNVDLTNLILPLSKIEGRVIRILGLIRDEIPIHSRRQIVNIHGYDSVESDVQVAVHNLLVERGPDTFFRLVTQRDPVKDIMYSNWGAPVERFRNYDYVS